MQPLGRQFRNRGSCYDAVAIVLDAATGATLDEHDVDGRAQASVCDIECEYRPPRGPPRAGIDQDSLGGLAVDAKGRPVVAGTIYDERRLRPRGFVARLR